MIATSSFNTKRMTLMIALLLAVVTGWLTLSYVRSVQSQNSLGVERPIYVAASDIPARATITADMLRRVMRPTATTESDAIVNPADAIGQVALITIPAGGSVTSSKLGRTADAGLPVRLANGKRAISIEVDKVKGVSGLIQPGDHVDVIAIPEVRAMNDAPPPAATILRGIRILAIGGSLEYISATPSPQEQNSSTVTLEVTPAQADLLAMADENMKIRLALRPPHEALNSEPAEALRFASPAPQIQAQAPSVAALAPARPAAPRAPSHASGIMIIDGDRIGYGQMSSDSNTPELP